MHSPFDNQILLAEYSIGELALMSLHTSLNGWKHHARWALQALAQLTPAQLPSLLAALQKIGNSQMDFYTGELTLAEIDHQVLSQLAQAEITTAEHYANWLATNQHYQMLRLSDDSEWVLRWGELAEQRVHLHPARYSPLSLRVRAPVLRSAYAILVWQQWYSGDAYNLSLINHVRATWLNLSPIVKLQPNEGLAELLATLIQIQTET